MFVPLDALSTYEAQSEHSKAAIVELTVTTLFRYFGGLTCQSRGPSKVSSPLRLTWRAVDRSREQ